MQEDLNSYKNSLNVYLIPIRGWIKGFLSFWKKKHFFKVIASEKSYSWIWVWIFKIWIHNKG